MSAFFNRAPHTPSERSVSSRMLAQEAEDDDDDDAPKASSSRASAPLKRLVARDMPYHQSSNRLQVRHQSSGRKNGPLFHWLYVRDWVHVLLRLRTAVSLLLFVVIWTIFLIIFALIYVAVDGQNPDIDCGLGKVPDTIKFNAAFAFSLETTTTVGYGLPNSGNGFFENCPNLQIAIYFQMLISMFFNALLMSFIFARVSRSERRSNQVLFSDKAILNRETLPNGIKRYVLSVRIYDADSMHPIVEAHVRFYAVKHRSMHADENEGTRFPVKMEPMRVSAPNDDLGAVLYTSIPTAATHHIDRHSPLQPPSRRTRGPEDGRVGLDSGFVVDDCGMDLRENDTYTGGQDGIQCAVCGETFNTVSNLIQHIRYNQHLEKHDEVPVQGSHQELDVESLFGEKPMLSLVPEGRNEAGGGSTMSAAKDTTIEVDKPPPPWYDEYRDYLRKSNVEIICVMEAIDPIMSGTFQAVQSYTSDDIAFDADFAPCVMADSDGGEKNMGWYRSRLFFGSSPVGRSVKIDLDSFHKTVPFGEG